MKVWLVSDMFLDENYEWNNPVVGVFGTCELAEAYIAADTEDRTLSIEDHELCV